ncbi:hypothetical protein Fmac_005909 [Flemingia macrophylla]|uniref:Uncharacterized protein n=1 Tax=Flemingia macrophylla TaxID=520843 RepID=A0ABD1N996_9FABA
MSSTLLTSHWTSTTPILLHLHHPTFTNTTTPSPTLSLLPPLHPITPPVPSCTTCLTTTPPISPSSLTTLSLRHRAPRRRHPTTTTVHHVSHTTVSNKPTVSVFTKVDPNFSLTIRRGEVILAPFDPTNEYQFSTTVKDEEGCPAFSLINKGTGEALKHSIGATHPDNGENLDIKPGLLDIK